MPASALAVVARKAKTELLLERLEPFAGRCKVLQSTMTAENEVLLRNLLDGGLSSLHFATTTPVESKS